jgi:energy-coupling factor transport system ATP-binding protein
MITIRGLRYRSLAIDAIDIPPGITSVIGPNGSGKSTLLKLCAGIAEPESGTVLVDYQLPRLTDAGYVNEFPDRNILFPTVKDELASPLRFRFTPCKETDRAVHVCAETLGIGYLMDRRMQDLSGGEKVLVAFAAAVITRPRVLVLDECDSHLDAGRCVWLEEALRSSGAEYVIRCTQQMETAAGSDHLLYLEKGRVLHAGSPAEVFSRLSGTSFYPLSWRWPK